MTVGCHALCPNTISLQLPPQPISQDQYTKHLVSGLQQAHKEFSKIKADLRRYHHEFYDSHQARNIQIPQRKIVCIRKDHTTKKNSATHFIRTFYGPYRVIGHYYHCPHLLKLQCLQSKEILKPTNIEKVVCVEEPDIFLRNSKQPRTPRTTRSSSTHSCNRF